VVDWMSSALATEPHRSHTARLKRDLLFITSFR
jgi:hypothetical protein